MNNFMKIAIEEAKKAGERGEVPIGAVIVCNNEIIATASNRTEELQDPTGHAELIAIQAATKKLGAARIPQCDLYVSLEPCNMCAAAISFARIRRLYFGASDPKMGGVDFYKSTKCHHRPEIYPGINEKEALDLVQQFFKSLR